MPTRPPAPLDPDERLGVDAVRALQLDRVRTTLRHAYDRVPHYRAAFASAGIHPDDVRTLADVARVPFTTKADLRAAYPFGMLAVPRDHLARVHASTGTTGQPTIVGYTAGDVETWAALVARSLRAAGVRPGDLVHVAYGYGLFTGGLGLHYGAERLGCTVVPAGGGQTEKQVRLITDLRPDAICVTPSYMLALGEEFVRQGLDPRASSLRIGVHGAEPWSDAVRREIETRYAIDAVDIYGLSEVMGPGVAMECVETKDGPHIWEDHFYPEIVDPETGAVLPDGATGELVLTTLTREAMPLVRYRTRDLTALHAGTARPGMRRLTRIRARSDDMLIVRGVNVFPSQLEELLLGDARCSSHWLVELRRTGTLDELTLVAELAPGCDDADGVATALAARVKDVVGVSVRVRAVAPGTLERSTGKARRVVDLRATT
ncbi:MAG TPA: phenylacetate--CoA ligase PaaK [Gemmatirosa sp.]